VVFLTRYVSFILHFVYVLFPLFMCLLFCLCCVIRGLIRWLCRPSPHNSKLLFNYRFNSNKHTHVFVRNMSFLGFIVGMCAFWYAICVYLKSLNMSPACGCWTQTFWQVTQIDSDIAAPCGKPRLVLYSVKINMSKSVALLPQVWNSIVNVRLWSTCPSEQLNQTTFMQVSFHTV